jgi:hypothetical protein
VETITPGWIFVSIGFEGDEVDLGGVNPWTSTWVPLGGRITVAHPSYPAERHTTFTYEAPGPDGAVVFAAGECSNGVKGPFQPE